MSFSLKNIAAQLSEAKELPKQQRAQSDNPFIAQVERSYKESVVLRTPSIPVDAERTVYVAIRRAAQQLGYGVSIRKEYSADNKSVVLVFRAQEKQQRHI